MNAILTPKQIEEIKSRNFYGTGAQGTIDALLRDREAIAERLEKIVGDGKKRIKNLREEADFYHLHRNESLRYLIDSRASELDSAHMKVMEVLAAIRGQPWNKENSAIRGEK